jgi:GT2 family glycosyltransferase
MEPPRRVRVVVPAYRALLTISDCIAAIIASPLSEPFEIVVVDDGENPGLAALLAPYAEVTIRNTGGSGSAAVARNLGCVDFEDGVLVFVDADVILDPQALEALVEPIRAGQAEACVGNYSTVGGRLSFAARYKQLYISHVYGRRAGYLRNDFWTAIGAVDAKTFHALDGFDISFRGACGEDGDLGGKLTSAGKRVLGIPHAAGEHRHAITLSGLILNDWRKGKVALANKAKFKGKLSDNSHARPRDIVAVGLAAATVMSSPISVFAFGWPTLVALSAYAAARRDLAAHFAANGTWFGVRAFWLMLLLDLVRCACVGSHVMRITPRPPPQPAPATPRKRLGKPEHA